MLEQRKIDQLCTMLDRDYYGKAYRRSDKYFMSLLKNNNINSFFEFLIQNDDYFLDKLKEHREWYDTSN